MHLGNKRTFKSLFQNFNSLIEMYLNNSNRWIPKLLYISRPAHMTRNTELHWLLEWTQVTSAKNCAFDSFLEIN